MAEPTIGENKPVTLMRVFSFPESERERAIEGWKQAWEFLKHEPGCLPTELHGSIVPDAKYQLVNVAKWESIETQTSAMTRMREGGAFPKIEGLETSQAFNEVIFRE